VRERVGSRERVVGGWLLVGCAGRVSAGMYG
jgi:hypothetical protein